jgi:hypothetical protein
MIKEISRDYTRGVLNASLDLINVPFAFPSFKRKANK